MDVLPNLLLEEPLQASQLVLLVKNLPAKAGGIKDRGQSLGWEDLPEEGIATHSNFFSGESHGHRLSYQATGHRVAKSQT